MVEAMMIVIMIVVVVVETLMVVVAFSCINGSGGSRNHDMVSTTLH